MCIRDRANTAKIVRKIREKFPLIPIIATGGPTEESILETIEAGANAITYTCLLYTSIVSKTSYSCRAIKLSATSYTF